MCRIKTWAVVLVCWGAAAAPFASAAITNVVETGGDNEATDTITAKFSGQTWPISVANEPTPGSAVGGSYTTGVFGHLAPTFVDRNHRYSDHTVQATAVPPNFTIPAYLLGKQYIMSGNDNRDNASYRLDVTVNTPSRAYLLIDNRLTDTNNANPPTFDATHMQWVLDQGWIATNSGLNRTSNPQVPDEVPLDEGSNNTIENWYSVYRKDFPVGTFSLFQADNAGQNMYGVVIGVIPEPASAVMLLLAASVGIAAGGRRRR